ncbi:ferredoxin--NADP reductase [Solitalea lacus]|uniref:ferredoxin--NADP reductase n=1 Tax=Solitalea lacus TaxID=2911172 RepID=UPI001EDC08EA|nr:ferredoxin--NADP reductase [Solitalea lacus]UKJ05917.1 ferredoxin--NADP reductase [Solitalea lacus]
MTKLKFRISDIKRHEAEAVELTLTPISGKIPDYKSGQFLSIIRMEHNREIRRSYSICSSPFIDEPLKIVIKRIENGELSRWVYNRIKTGDFITTLAPGGQFIYQPENNRERTLFLFAAGVGITPLFSILKTALVAENKSKVVLIYSNKHYQLALFHDELIKWGEKYPNRLTILNLFSQSQNLLSARLNKQLIQELVQKHLEYERAKALFYTCGPMSYMDICRLTLLGMGFDKSQIKRETFFITNEEGDDDDESENTPKDINTYTVKLQFRAQQYVLSIPYNKTILDVALANHLDLPYSCRAGMCSTCMANCTNGIVKMDYNEVLTDEEVAKGKVLLCVGHPTQNNIEISYQ